MNNLDRYNEHILQGSNKTDSFIANVNYIARKFEDLMQVDEKFDAETVKLLAQLVKNSLDINIAILSEDLRKGSHYGYRKLDIDLLTNFKDYDYYLSDEKKNQLWNTPASQVYYKAVDVYLSDDNSKILKKNFSQRVSNHHQLYDELINWKELKNEWGFTFLNLSPDTALLDHELLRITDDYDENSGVGSNAGSRITRIVLHVDNNPEYNSMLAGAKSNTPTFSWVDTTSSLLTIAHKINDIIYAANYVQEVGKDFVDTMERTLQELERLNAESNDYKNTAGAYALRAEDAFNKQVGLTVATNVIDVDALPSVLYNSAQNKMTFGLPRSETAIVGLSGFEIDTGNGHLSFNIRGTEDIYNAYVNESGRIVLELNK